MLKKSLEATERFEIRAPYANELLECGACFIMHYELLKRTYCDIITVATVAVVAARSGKPVLIFDPKRGFVTATPHKQAVC